MSHRSRLSAAVLVCTLAAFASTVGVAGAPAARADTPAPTIGSNETTNDAVAWTPPPEPALVPVPATACPDRPDHGEVTCLAEVPGVVPDTKAHAAGRADAIATSDTAAAPLPEAAVPQALTQSGQYTPAQLASLYRVPAGLSSTATIGIVDVGSDPNTQAQLSYYRSYFGLPACTKKNGCVREVAQDGSTALPPTDSGWVTEIALDVQAVSAICPTCHILLVDARSASSTDMGAAVNTAVRLGAKYVSLSFGAPDSSQNATLNRIYYSSPGVTYVAASGDRGYSGGTLFPSTASNVVAAGGTSVVLDRGVWRQRAWSGAGSGCSSAGLVSSMLDSLVQRLLSASACPTGRAVTDVSALADPATGILFYRGGNWYSGGGTSLAAPLITALYALAGNHTDPLAIYRNVTARPSAFVDITSGQTGSCGTVLCTARAGWDGPTGVGTPAGLAGLAARGTAPLAAPSTAGALHLSGSYPARLQYRLVDATTGAPVPRAPVLIEANTGHGFALLVRSTTGADGSLSYVVRPHGATSYRVFYGGAATHASSVSATVRAAAFTARVTVRRTAHGLRVRATAPWQQGAGALRIKVQRHTHGWHTVTKRKTSARGKASVRLRPGVYRIAYGGGQWRKGHTGSVRIGR